MLEQILHYLKNFFEVYRVYGSFVIEGGEISPLSLTTGQYYYISGSMFNDGLHKHGFCGLADETFTGTVRICAIPNVIIKLAEEIEAWNEKYGEAANSPYQSESFGGYSYSKGNSANGNGASWQTAFRSRLNPWRKI